MIAALVLMTAVGQATPQQTVQLQGSFFGATIDTPLRLQAHQTAGKGAAAVLEADAEGFRYLAEWVERSGQAVGLDDYGKLRLVVSAVDSLPVRVAALRGPPQTVGDAVESGLWTADSRLMAIGGGMRALGVAVTVFEPDRGPLLLGVSCDDRELNVDAIQQDWRQTIAGRVRQTSVRWVLWDGVRAVGEVHPKTAPTRLEQGLPKGRSLSLAQRRTPDFVLKRVQPDIISLRGVRGQLQVNRRPDAAGYLSLAPEMTFSALIPAARQEVRWLGLDRAARRALRHTSGEVERLDLLIRLVQSAFKYEPGPVRSMPELLETRRGDCDQLSLLLGALLLELGYGEDDVVAVSWPDHLGLAVRPKHGGGPDGSVGVNLEGGRYHLIDVTHYVWRGDRLVSRWGASAPEHGAQVTVQRLSGS